VLRKGEEVLLVLPLVLVLEQWISNVHSMERLRSKWLMNLLTIHHFQIQNSPVLFISVGVLMVDVWLIVLVLRDMLCNKLKYFLVLFLKEFFPGYGPDSLCARWLVSGKFGLERFFEPVDKYANISSWSPLSFNNLRLP